MVPLESSTLLLMSILARNKEKEKINDFSYISRTHSTLGEKKFIPFYDEDLYS